jgi:hypothetical protein
MRQQSLRNEFLSKEKVVKKEREEMTYSGLEMNSVQVFVATEKLNLWTNDDLRHAVGKESD